MIFYNNPTSTHEDVERGQKSVLSQMVSGANKTDFPQQLPFHSFTTSVANMKPDIPYHYQYAILTRQILDRSCQTLKLTQGLHDKNALKCTWRPVGGKLIQILKILLINIFLGGEGLFQHPSTRGSAYSTLLTRVGSLLYRLNARTGLLLDVLLKRHLEMFIFVPFLVLYW